MIGAEGSREIRSAVMAVFRRWGGQWNVTVAPAPEGPGGPGGPGTARSWRLVIHSRRVVSGALSGRAAESLLRGEGEAEGAWAAELQRLFQAAVEASKED